MVRRSRRQRGGGQLQELPDAVNNAEQESEAHREATQKLNAYELTPEGIAEVEAEAEAKAETERQKMETAAGGRRRRRSRKSRRPRKSRRSRRSRKSRRSRRH